MLVIRQLGAGMGIGWPLSSGADPIQPQGKWGAPPPRAGRGVPCARRGHLRSTGLLNGGSKTAGNGSRTHPYDASGGGGTKQLLQMINGNIEYPGYRVTGWGCAVNGIHKL